MSHDFVVVGSGPSGAHAAQGLLEAGERVLMLDAGFRDEKRYGDRVPEQDFISVRRTDKRQHEYFLGDDFEGIPVYGVRAGATLSASRQYVIEGARRWLASRAENFQPIESLATGGLGQA